MIESHAKDEKGSRWCLTSGRFPPKILTKCSDPDSLPDGPDVPLQVRTRRRLRLPTPVDAHEGVPLLKIGAGPGNVGNPGRKRGKIHRKPHIPLRKEDPPDHDLS